MAYDGTTTTPRSGLSGSAANSVLRPTYEGFLRTRLRRVGYKRPGRDLTDNFRLCAGASQLLTVIVWEEYVEQARLGQKVILIGNVVYDIAGFIKEHPGGMALIQSGIGKDATELFNGDLYQHSNAARNFLSSMRVAVIKKSSRSD
jgi:cytochrome b involved in lipid metabolism